MVMTKKTLEVPLAVASIEDFPQRLLWKDCTLKFSSDFADLVSFFPKAPITIYVLIRMIRQVMKMMTKDASLS